MTVAELENHLDDALGLVGGGPPTAGGLALARPPIPARRPSDRRIAAPNPRGSVEPAYLDNDAECRAELYLAGSLFAIGRFFELYDGEHTGMRESPTAEFGAG